MFIQYSAYMLIQSWTPSRCQHSINHLGLRELVCGYIALLKTGIFWWGHQCWNYSQVVLRTVKIILRMDPQNKKFRYYFSCCSMVRNEHRELTSLVQQRRMLFGVYKTAIFQCSYIPNVYSWVLETTGIKVVWFVYNR